MEELDLKPTNTNSNFNSYRKPNRFYTPISLILFSSSQFIFCCLFPIPFPVSYITIHLWVSVFWFFFFFFLSFLTCYTVSAVIGGNQQSLERDPSKFDFEWKGFNQSEWLTLLLTIITMSTRSQPPRAAWSTQTLHHTRAQWSTTRVYPWIGPRKNNSYFKKDSPSESFSPIPFFLC